MHSAGEGQNNIWHKKPLAEPVEVALKPLSPRQEMKLLPLAITTKLQHTRLWYHLLYNRWYFARDENSAVNVS